MYWVELRRPQYSVSCFDEGAFKCEEHAGRYTRYEWNPLLKEGYELARAGEGDGAIHKLKQAIAISPRSPAGQSVLGDLLASKGLLGEALTMAQEALDLDMGNPHYMRRLARIRSNLLPDRPRGSGRRRLVGDII